MLYFITGNKSKFEEVATILPGTMQLNIDLPEIQEIDQKKIIEAKLLEAAKQHNGEFIVEDTGLFFDCLNGLPGPLIKWFEKTIGNSGLADIADNLGNNKAKARTIIGYFRDGQISYFEGEISGQIVQPRGETNFGWDPIFQPEGFDHTFAEMTREEKNEISMRRQALNKLRGFLDNGAN